MSAAKNIVTKKKGRNITMYTNVKTMVNHLAILLLIDTYLIATGLCTILNSAFLAALWHMLEVTVSKMTHLTIKSNILENYILRPFQPPAPQSFHFQY